MASDTDKRLYGAIAILAVLGGALFLVNKKEKEEAATYTLSGQNAALPKITISEVAVRLGFSPGAIREALSRLSAEKWAVATAQKGYSVAPVSTEELKDLTRTRIAIEQLCLRAAIAHGDVEWETSIVAAYHRLHRVPIAVAGDASRLNPGWAAAHRT